MSTKEFSGSARKIAGMVGTLLEMPLFLVATRMQGGVVLTYHRVGPDPDPFYPPIHPDLFRSHLELVQNHFSMIPLDELVTRLQSRRSLRGCCAITFDDGFSDFECYAYPILKELNVPATHFVTSQGLMEGRPTWNYRLNRLLHYMYLSDQLDHSQRDADPPTWTEILRVTDHVAALSVEEREEVLCKLEQHCTLPPDPPMLRPSDLQRMDKNLVQWGSHTATHASLPFCTDEGIRYELTQSRETLESALGERPRFLAYPNGHFDSRTMKTAAECGYLASFTVGQRRVVPGTPLHGIPRFDVGGLPTNMVGLELAGLTPGIRSLRARMR